jgi:hypothetical protein
MEKFFVEPALKKEFTLYFYDRHVNFMKKYSFDEEICIDKFTKEEQYVIGDLKEFGLIYSFFVNNKEYVQGTKIYQQYKITTI